MYLGKCWGLVDKLLEISKGLTVGALPRDRGFRGHRGVASNPVAISRKCSPLGPRSVRGVSKHVRNTRLGSGRDKGRGPRGKAKAKLAN